MNNLPIIRYSVAEVGNCLNIVEGIRRGITRDICGEELIGLLPYQADYMAKQLNWLERSTHNAEVGSSSLPFATLLIACPE